MTVTLERELVRAANSAATTRPLIPGRSRLSTKVAYILSGNTSGKSTLPARPGNTRMNTGRIFRKPARMVAFLASRMFLAAKVRCTII